MRKRSKVQWGGRLLAGAAALMTAVVIGISVDGLSIVSRAETQGRVKVNSAKIRSEASTSSTQVASAVRDKTLSIISTVQGGDGYDWYEVWVDANTKGFIRSDLVEVTEGTPATPKPSTQATPVPEEPADITNINPISATVKDGSSVRVRDNASTNSHILATVSTGLVVTVTGKANGVNGDGYVWYYVNYISGNVQVKGFIREDFLTLSEEVTPPQSDVTPEPPDATEPPAQEEKMYDTIFQDGVWKVYNTSTHLGWKIEELINGAQSNGELLEDSQKTVKNQKIIIIILVILLVGAGTGVAYLIFKLKDTMDSIYFNQVESETLRRRSTAASQGGSQRVTHTVGAERQSSRPAGAQSQRQAGSSQGQRPAGSSQGQRPAGSSQGQRPAGGPQGQRPAGSPQGQRPAGTAQGQRPAGSSQSQRPAGNPQGQRPAGSPQGQKPTVTRQSTTSNPKNFMADDDDEFEFEFLNVDGGDEK